MYTMHCDGVGFYSPLLISEGYGVLSPKITFELNKAGSLQFVLPPDNVMYNGMKKLKSVITVEKDGEEIFRGRVLHDDRDFYNRKTVYCEGELSYLLDSVVRPYNFSGSVSELFTKFIHDHNAQVESGKRFAIGRVDFIDLDVEEQYETIVFKQLTEEPEDWVTDFGEYYFKHNDTYYQVEAESAPEFEGDTYYRKDTEAQTRMTQTEAESSEYPNTFDEITSKLVEEFGGYLRVRYEEGIRYLDYVSSFGTNSGQVISCGENMLDLSEYITAENLITCLIPLGSGEDGEQLTIASVNDGKDYISNQTAIGLFGKIWATQTWDNISNAEKLKLKAEEYLNNNISMNVSLTVQAVDLNLIDVETERLKLGDSVRVLSSPHNLDTYFLCSRVVLDLQEADKSEYTFGYAFNALTDQQIDEKKTLYNKIAVSKVVGNKALEIANEALAAANSARGYAAGASSALKKKQDEDVVALSAAIEEVNSSLELRAEKKTVEELNGTVTEIQTAQASLTNRVAKAETTLLQKAEKTTVEELDESVKTLYVGQSNLATRVGNAESSLLQKVSVTEFDEALAAEQEAITELSSSIGDVEASLKLKAEKSAVEALDGTVTTIEKSVATLQADIIELEGRVDVTGSVSITDGGIRVEGNATIGGNIHVNGATYLDTTSFYVAGVKYSPQTITSTDGDVTVLGY